MRLTSGARDRKDQSRTFVRHPRIRKNIDRLKQYPFDFICPSHGPTYDRPSVIVDAYSDWVSEKPKNEAVVAFVSMHGSTRILAEHLVIALAQKGVTVRQFDLSVTDVGKFAISLVDAATIVLGTPTVHVGPHPLVAYAAHLANALRPKVRFTSIIGSYGWATKAVDQLSAAIPNMKVEILSPVLCKGVPGQKDLEAIEGLSEEIAKRHATLM